MVDLLHSDWGRLGGVRQGVCMVVLRGVGRLVDSLTQVPGLRQLLHEVRFRRNLRENLFRGVYASFDAAAATKPSNGPLGYDNPDAAVMYRDRMKVVFPTDYPVLFWLQQLFAKGCTQLFELGGHVGVSYYAYQTVMSYPDALCWVVSDVPAVMERGAVMSKNMDELGKLSFEGDFSKAAQADVFLAMGVLQYLPETLADRLASLERMPRHLLLNLTPLHPAHAYFTLQSIGTAFCPYRIEQMSAFLDSLKALGYTVRDTWINPDKACKIHLHPKHSLDHYYGFYLQHV